MDLGESSTSVGCEDMTVRVRVRSNTGAARNLWNWRTNKAKFMQQRCPDPPFWTVHANLHPSRPRRLRLAATFQGKCFTARVRVGEQCTQWSTLNPCPPPRFWTGDAGHAAHCDVPGKLFRPDPNHRAPRACSETHFCRFARPGRALRPSTWTLRRPPAGRWWFTVRCPSRRG